MADQNPQPTPESVSPPAAPRVPAIIAATPSEQPKPSSSAKPPKVEAPESVSPPAAPPAAPAPSADALAEEKRRWAEEHARAKAAKQKLAPKAAKQVTRHRPQVHSGWKVTSPIRFRNANGGEPEDRAVDEVVPLDHFAEQDQANFLACGAIKAHFTEVSDDDDQVEPVDGDDVA